MNEALLASIAESNHAAASALEADRLTKMADAQLALRARVPGVIRTRAEFHVKMERAETAEERFRLNMSQRVLAERVERHLNTERSLASLGADIEESMSKGMRSQQTLDSLEARIIKMRAGMRASNDAQDALEEVAAHAAKGNTFAAASLRFKMGAAVGKTKSAAAVVAEELAVADDVDDMEGCPKCGRRFLPGFLAKHLEDCDGRFNEVVSDDESDVSESDDEEDVEETGAGGGVAVEGGAAAAAAGGSRTAAAGGSNLSSRMLQCPLCMRKFMRVRFNDHMVRCVKKKQLARTLETHYGSKTVQVPIEFATPPSAVRGVRQLTPTSNSVSIVWEPPLWDGGQPIVDYHIEYFVRVPMKGSRPEDDLFEDVKQAPVQTSRWIMLAPIMHKGFTLRGLGASADIVNLRVRAVNSRGSSEWSEPCAPMRTLHAVQSTPPLHVRLVGSPSPSSFQLEWEEPYDTGGLDVDQYEIRYALLVHDFATSVRLGVRFGRKSVEKVVRVSAARTQATVSGFFGDAHVADITVFAVTALGLSPPSNRIALVVTPPMSREDLVTLELEMNRARRDIEVDVWHDDRAQRFNRLQYIRLLDAELENIKAARARAEFAALEAEAAAETARLAAGGSRAATAAASATHTSRGDSLDLPSRPDSASSVAATAAPTADRDAALVTVNTKGAAGVLRADPGAVAVIAATRKGGEDAERDSAQVQREHFYFRIEALQKLIQTADDKLLALNSRRSSVKMLLAQMDKRLAILRAELWRLADCELAHVDTNFFGNGVQRLQLSELRGLIAHDMKDIARRSQALVRENYRLDTDASLLKKRRDEAEQLTHERQTALFEFEARESRIAHAHKYGLRVKDGLPFKVFDAWRALAARTHRKKAALRRVAGFLSNRTLFMAFRRWYAWMLEEKRASVREALQERKQLSGGLGAALICEAERQRGDAETDVMKLLGWLRDVETQLDSVKDDASYRRILRGVNAFGGVAASDAAGDVPAHRLIGPPMTFTQPLAAAAAATAPIPSLTLIDNFVPVPALRMLSQESGADIVLSAQAMKSFRSVEDVAAAHWVVKRQRIQLAALGPSALLHGGLGESVEDWARERLAAAQAYHDIGNVERAMVAAKQAELVYGFKCDAGGLLGVYRLLAHLLEKLARFDFGVLHWDRCVELARMDAIRDPLAEAEALEGRARCLRARSYVEDALSTLELAENIYATRNDMPALARVYRAQSGCLEMLRFYEKAQALVTKAVEIETRASNLVRAGIERLAALELVVASSGVDTSRRVQLELVAPAAPLLMQQLRFIESELYYTKKAAAKSQNAFLMNRSKVGKLGDEARIAEASEALSMETSLLTGTPQVYRLNEIRVLLRQEEEKTAKQAALDVREARRLSAMETLLAAEAVDVRRYLAVEKRELAELVAARRPLAVVALNAANVLANDVLGLSEGSEPLLAVAMHTSIFSHSTLDGAAQNAFVGEADTESSTGEPVGHTKHVTALAMLGDRIYSGSADATIRVWDARCERGWGKRTPIHEQIRAENDAHIAEQRADEKLRREAAEKVGEEYHPRAMKPLELDQNTLRKRHAGLVMTLLGHTGAVTALAANARILFSGGADRQILLWNRRDGRMLRKLRGHDLTISAIAAEDAFFSTGSNDRQVILWKISVANELNPAQGVDLVQRFAGHAAAITALAIRGATTVSGDADGWACVWDAASPAALRAHKIHARGVTAVAFDSSKIISSGLDHRLIFTDIASGASLIRLREPHGPAAVLALQFDTQRMVSVASDHSMRHWPFRGAEALPAIRTLTLRAGERLPVISRKYGVPLRALLRWNSIKSSASFFEGMRVVVAPLVGSRGFDVAIAEQLRDDADSALRSVGESIYAAEKEKVRAEEEAAAEKKRAQKEMNARNGIDEDLGEEDGAPLRSVNVTPPKVALLGERPALISPPSLVESVSYKVARASGAKRGQNLVDMLALAETSARSLGLRIPAVSPTVENEFSGRATSDGLTTSLRSSLKKTQGIPVLDLAGVKGITAGADVAKAAAAASTATASSTATATMGNKSVRFG